MKHPQRKAAEWNLQRKTAKTASPNGSSDRAAASLVLTEQQMDGLFANMTLENKVRCLLLIL